MSTSSFEHRPANNGGWSENITASTFNKLVGFFKKRATVHINASGSCLYHVAPKRQNGLNAAGGGLWFHIDDNLDTQEPETFRVVQGESLTLLDLTFLGEHANIWKQISAAVNLAPDLLAAGVKNTKAGKVRYNKIKNLTDAIGESVSGKDALHAELWKMGILSDEDSSRWFWHAVDAAGADGYVSYDHGESRLVDTLSPDLLQRDFLPPVVDKFQYTEDAMVLASRSQHAVSNEMIVSSKITFPQVALTARGAHKLNPPFPTNRQDLDFQDQDNPEDQDEESENPPQQRASGCVLS